MHLPEHDLAQFTSLSAIEEFGEKSYEYGVYTGEITPGEEDDSDETNGTNESRISTAQEEPLEVITPCMQILGYRT